MGHIWFSQCSYELVVIVVQCCACINLKMRLEEQSFLQPSIDPYQNRGPIPDPLMALTWQN